jgi:hypothetical protein
LENVKEGKWKCYCHGGSTLEEDHGEYDKSSVLEKVFAVKCMSPECREAAERDDQQFLVRIRFRIKSEVPYPIGPSVMDI